MKKAALLLMLITILTKLMGFGREIVLSYIYGASAITDAYLVSQTIPNVIFAFISTSIATSFTPMYSRIFQEQGVLSANKYTNNLSNALLLLASIFIAIVLLFAQPIVKLFATGFPSETVELTVRFTRISVFGIYSIALFGLLSSYLRIYDNYVIPSLVRLPMNLISIAFFFISVKTNICALAIGSVLATATQLLLLIPSLRKTGYRYQPVLDLKDKQLKMMAAIALPVVISTSVNEVNILIDRTLASRIAVGGISALNYAFRLNGFVQGLFVVSLTTVLYPMISKMAAEKNIKGLKGLISEAISLICLLVIPATIGAMAFSKEIVGLLFGRGAFTPEAIEMTASALFYYSIGMIAVGVKDILSPAFYALQDTKTPMIFSTIAVILNVILNLILSRYLGIGGLALATSIAATANALLMFIALRRKIGGFGAKKTSQSFLKISIASFLMVCSAMVSFGILKGYLQSNLSLVLAIGVGVSAYLVLIFILKIPEVDRIVEAVKIKNGKKFGENSEIESRS